MASGPGTGDCEQGGSPFVSFSAFVVVTQRIGKTSRQPIQLSATTPRHRKANWSVHSIEKRLVTAIHLFCPELLIC